MRDRDRAPVGVSVNIAPDPVDAVIDRIRTARRWDDWYDWMRRYAWEGVVMREALDIALDAGKFNPFMDRVISGPLRVAVDSTIYGVVQDCIDRAELPPNVRERWDAEPVQDGSHIDIQITNKVWPS